MLAGIVQTVTSQEHGLDDDVPLKHLHHGKILGNFLLLRNL